MPPPINKSRSVPDEVLRKLADLALIPAEHHEFFFDSICMNVQTACELDGLVKGGLANEKGATLYRAALELYEMLGNLNEDERKLIEGILGRSGLFDRISSGGVGELRQTAYQLAELFSYVTGEPHPRYPHQAPQPRQRGQKRGWVKHPIFHKFAFDIYLSTKVAGGYLTFDKNVPLGTSWFVAIEMLAPHLPAGFVPEPFPVRLYNGFRLGATASKCLWIDNDYRLMVSKYIHLIIIRVALLNRPRHNSTGQN